MHRQIEFSLIKALRPEELEVVDESYKHNVPQNSESHFKILAISSRFNNLSKVERHKMIFKILEAEFQSIHALSLALYTPEEWEQHPTKVHQTPDCSKKGHADEI